MAGACLKNDEEKSENIDRAIEFIVFVLVFSFISLTVGFFSE